METTLLLRKFMLLSSLCLFASLGFSQVTQQWVRRYNSPISNDGASAVRLDSLGNVYVSGNNGTIKYDINGNQLWVERSISAGSAFIVDPAGNIYTFREGRGKKTLLDFVTSKYDTNGNQVWEKRYNGPENFDDHTSSMAVDRLGNVYVTGISITKGSSWGYTTVKYSKDGEELWVKRYGNPVTSYHAIALALDTSANVYVTGWEVTLKYDTHGKELWVHNNEGAYNAIAVDYSGNVYVTGDEHTAKYDANGNKVWIKNATGSSLVVDSSGNVYIVGNATIKYNTTGKQLWTRKDGGKSLVLDATGNIYVTGVNGTIKYNANGKQIWVAGKGGSSVTVDHSENVYVAGSTGDAPNTDYATTKYDIDGSEIWVKTYNGPGNVWDIANALVVDGAGNVYVTGGSNGDLVTIKYDTYGKQRWVKRDIGQGYIFENVRSVAVDGSGNVYIAATIMSLETYEESITILKYNAEGEEQWVKTYSGSTVTAMIVDVAGNVYVTGSVGLNFETDYIIIKYDTSGNQLWVKTYNGLYSGIETANSLAVDRFGNVYVTGESQGIPDPELDVSNTDYVTIKYDAHGKELWVRRHDADPSDNEIAYALAIDSTGNVYVSGTSNFINATIKYDTNGNELWMKELVVANAFVVDRVGYIYVTGRTYTGVTTAKYDTNGDELWIKERKFICAQYCVDVTSSLVVDSVGNVYVSGSLNDDYATIKYDINGKEQWLKSYNGPENVSDAASALDLDRLGNVYVTGTSGSTSSNIDIVTIKYVQTAPLKVDAGKDRTTHYLPITPTCTFLSAQVKGGAPPYEYSWSLTGASSQSTLVCPSQTTTYTVTVTDANGLKATDKVTVNVIDVRCGNSKDKVQVCYQGAMLCLSPWQAFWLLWQGATLGSCPAGPITGISSTNKADQEELNASKTFKVYSAPNPFSNSSQIFYELPLQGQVSIKVYDAVGRQITTIASGNHKAGIYNGVFTATGLSKGIYYYQVNYTTKQHQTMSKTGKMLLVK